MNPWYRQIIKEAGYYRNRRKNKFTEKRIPCTAIIDTGIYPHPLLSGEIKGFADMMHHKNTPYDDHGHGTHIAGIIGGRGIFPSASLYGIKVLDEHGNGKVSVFLKGMEHLMHEKEQFRIRILNISLGTPYEDSREQKNLLACVESAWEQGILVIAAAGNNGPEKGSITVPGMSKKIITVGTYDDHIPVSSPFSGKKKNHYSGRGPTKECVVKPDVRLPGANIMSLNVPNGFTVKSGTSMSTPMLCALSAMVLTVHPDLTPKEIKKAVLACCSADKKLDCRRFLSYFDT